MAELVEVELDDPLDLVRAERVGEPLRDEADDRQDLEGGDDGRRRGQSADDLDGAGVEADLLAGLAERALDERLAGIGSAARERDLAGMAAHVAAALGEDQAGPLGPAEERHQDRRALLAVGVEPLGLDRVEERAGEVGRFPLAQMITWTVPPSAPQAAPAT